MLSSMKPYLLPVSHYKIEWTNNTSARWGLYLRDGAEWKPVKFFDHFCQAHDEMMLMRKVHLFDAEGKPIT